MKSSTSEYISPRNAMTRDRIVEISRIAAERVADKRAGAPASVKIIQRAAELRRSKIK